MDETEQTQGSGGEPGAPPQRYRLKAIIPISVLRAKPKDAVMLLRFGAATNAVTATARVLSEWKRPDEPESLSQARDHLQILVMAAGLLCETIRLLDEYGERPWQLIRLAVESRYYHLDQQYLRMLLDKRKESLYKRFLARWRDKLAFHWDSAPFQAYLEGLSTDEVEMWHWTVPPVSNLKSYSRAALEVLYIDVAGKAETKLDDAAMAEIRDAQLSLSVMYEAVLFGFLIEQGLRPLQTIKEDERP